MSAIGLERWPRIGPMLCSVSLSVLLLCLPFGRPSAPWLSLLVLSMLVAGLLAYLVSGRAPLRHLPLLIVFVGISLLSAHFSPYSEVAMHRAAAGLLLTLVFPAAQVIGSDPRALEWMRRVMLIAIVLSAADIGWQYAFGHSLLVGIPAPVDRWRFSGSLSNANEVGFIAILLPFATAPLGCVTTPLTCWARRTRWIPWSATALATFGVLLTGSRTTLGGLFVGASTRSWFGRRTFLKWSLAALLAVGAIGWIGDFGSFRRRLDETLQPQNEMRLATWRIAAEAFIERPLLGQGPAVFFEVNHASRLTPREAGWETPPGGMPWVHNLPLELLAERGLLGTGVFVLLLGFIAVDVRRALRDPIHRPRAAAVTASLITFAAMSMLDLTLLKDWCSLCLWLILGFAASIGATNASASREAQGAPPRR